MMGSIMANTLVEGYPGRRYHAGSTNVDAIENLAIERAKRFGEHRPRRVSRATIIKFARLLKALESEGACQIDGSVPAKGRNAT